MKVAFYGLDLGHPKAFAPIFRKRGMDIHSVVASDPVAAAEFAEANGCPVLTAEALEVRANELDGLVVANMTKDRSAVRGFLEKGIPVYFNKHIGLDAAAAADLLQAADRGGAPVLAGSVLRYSPPFRAVQGYAHRGDLGKPVIVESYLPYPPNPGNWQDNPETSGGFLINYGIHCIDVLCSILGSDFQTVYCVGGKFLFEKAETIDSCVITIQFANGSIGVAEIFGAQEPFQATQPSLRVHGTKRSVEAFLDEGLLRTFRGSPFYDEKSYSYCSGNEDSVEAIIEMMRTRKQPVPVPELLAVPQILDFARASLETGQIKVRAGAAAAS